MEMPKPTEAHQKLAALAGRWTGSETIPPCPWDPKGDLTIGPAPITSPLTASSCY